MDINRNDTAVVFIDPQNEVLSDKGLAWGSVGDSVRENRTVENMERIFKAAKASRVGLRLHGGAHKFRVSRKSGPDNGRGTESYEIAAYKQ